MRWTYDTRIDGAPLEFHGNPLVTSELVIVGSDLRQKGSVAFVYAFERESGRVRWKTPVDVGVMTDVLSIGETLCGATLEDHLIGLDRKSGKILWRFETGSATDLGFRTSSPATDGRRIYFATGAGSLHAVDAQTGKAVWKSTLGSRPMTSVLLLEGGLFVGTHDRHLRRLKPESGQVEGELTLSDVPLSTLAVSGGRLLFFLGERAIAAVDPDLNALRWTQTLDSTLSTARPTVWKDSILVGSESGVLRSLRASDGAEEWSETFPAMVRGIGSTAEMLYLGTLNGDVYAWSPGRRVGMAPTPTGK